jgi:hypothetical protein
MPPPKKQATRYPRRSYLVVEPVGAFQKIYIALSQGDVVVAQNLFNCGGHMFRDVDLRRTRTERQEVVIYMREIEDY